MRINNTFWIHNKFCRMIASAYMMRIPKAYPNIWFLNFTFSKLFFKMDFDIINFLIGSKICKTALIWRSYNPIIRRRRCTCATQGTKNFFVLVNGIYPSSIYHFILNAKIPGEKKKINFIENKPCRRENQGEIVSPIISKYICLE